MENLITKKIPATTSVDEWIKADAGVGASMASGNQTWAKNCAAFIVPDSDRKRENTVNKWKPQGPTNVKWNAMKGTKVNITDRSVVLKTSIVNVKAKNINMSLIREKAKVFKAALIV